MSYVFDVSSRDNDLGEVDYFVLHVGHGDYQGTFGREVGEGHILYTVEFSDKRYALQFKLQFNATVVKWDESDDQEIVTIEELVERGYQEVRLDIASESVMEFTEWCEERDFPIVDEIKFVGETEPFKVYVPSNKALAFEALWICRG
jgi:hypothetical protein